MTHISDPPSPQAAKQAAAIVSAAIASSEAGYMLVRKHGRADACPRLTDNPDALAVENDAMKAQTKRITNFPVVSALHHAANGEGPLTSGGH